MSELKVTYHNINELIPDPGNARLHDRRNIDAIKQSIQRFGIRKPIVVDEDTKTIWAGNGVYMAAIELGMVELPVAWIPSGTPKEVKQQFSLFDNRTNELSSFDPVKLDSLLATLPDVNLDSLLWTSDELDTLLESIESNDKEETFDVVKVMEAESEPITKTGDIWLCGKHKVMCDDSTKQENVERLCLGKKASMIWTDPPYGVHYGEKLESSNPMGYRVRTIYGDNLSADNLEKMIRKAYILAAQNSILGASIYAMSPPGTLLPIAIAAFKNSGFDFHWQLVWIKDSLVLSRADYHFRHENILYGWKPDGTHYFVNDRTQDSVFEIPRPKKSEEHPTMKPINLIEAMIKNSSHNGDIVYDPFLGSGSTLMACIKTNRILYGMEISPHYCDVVCKRYFEFTGNRPIRELDNFEFKNE